MTASGRRFAKVSLISGAITLALGAAFTWAFAGALGRTGWFLGAALILTFGLGAWRHTLMAPAALGAAGGRAAAEAQAKLFDLTQRIEFLLTANWLSAAETPVKRRLKATLATWREELMTDLPLTGGELMQPKMRHMALTADAALAQLEELQFAESEDAGALEEAERAVVEVMALIPPRA